MKLLNDGNTKTSKGESLGWKTYGIHLAPHKLSGRNVCPHASTGCALACLNTAGRGIMASVQAARIAKTRLFWDEREAFMCQLFAEVEGAIASASRAGMRPCFRLNLTSDIEWSMIRYKGRTVFAAFPGVQFYDYTKNPARMGKFLRGELPANYHLTFSRSECNDADVSRIMAQGGNVAVVFRGALPARWRRRRVVDGDVSDLRFLDPRGVVVGLVEKGLAKRDASGFVVEGGAL